MQVKKYVARSFAEALIQAKNELGSDAMIVETRKLRVGGFLGLFGRELTEITVAAEQSGSNRAARQPARASAPTAAQAAPAPIANLERELAGLRSAVTVLLDRTRNNEPWLQGYAREVFTLLQERGVNEETATEIARQVQDGKAEKHEALRLEVARLIGQCSPITIQPGQRKVVALVGPTGVGKTTTLAKLAARFTLEHGLTVGMVTFDTYRIAAVQQLRTYAEILGLPVHAVESPAEVAQALRETAHCDLVLVDTAGRGHRDGPRILELREILAMLRPHETHLVCSLTVNNRDLLDMMEVYIPLGVTKLTFTKLDETTSPGTILNVRSRYDLPLGYITHGQAVPEDISPADVKTLTNVLLGV